MTTSEGTLGPAFEDIAPRRRANLWGDAWRRLIRNKLAVIGMTIIL
ncbi:MAG: ABC transporter permease, partial [Dehalococcoidia bacterium]